MKISPLAPKIPPVLHPVPGLRLATAKSGMKYQGRDDVMLMVADAPAVAVGALTQSKTCSAAVDWCQDIFGQGTARAVLVNAGNANAFTGRQGAESVARCAAAAAAAIGANPKDILLASTGVIGEPMDDALITAHLTAMTARLDENAWASAAAAIMTTDSFTKATSSQIEITGQTITITGIAKGSGMIAPNMATMLAFIGTDAKITAADLKAIIGSVINESFNAISVDGDTSTSDTVAVMATGLTGELITGDSLSYFKQGLKGVMVELAQLIVRDGEGAQKFITIDVSGGEDDDAARRVGLTIANSPLVKTAIAGGDANWGRVVMAAGKSGEKVERDRLKISIGGILVAAQGRQVENYDETPVATHIKGDAVSIAVDLGVGSGTARVWSCDLTHGYIEINADYRS
jgi:glutamate N-acetyltransferase/amino-acid N-acetyltransferase